MDEVTVGSVHLDSHEPGSPRLPGRGSECGDEILDLTDLQGPRAPADVDERRYRGWRHGVTVYHLRAYLTAAMAELETRRSPVGRDGSGQRGESSGRAVEPHPRNLPLDSTLRRNRPEGHYRHPHIVGCELRNTRSGAPWEARPGTRIRSSWATAVFGSRARAFRGAKTKKGLDTSSELPSLARVYGTGLRSTHDRQVRRPGISPNSSWIGVWQTNGVDD